MDEKVKIVRANKIPEDKYIRHLKDTVCGIRDINNTLNRIAEELAVMNESNRNKDEY
jgi:hypothetical protein